MDSYYSTGPLNPLQDSMSATPPKMHQVYLGLGTNLGDRQGNLQQAVDGLATELSIGTISPVYATAPWGVVEQPDFLNLCLLAETRMPPRELLHFLKQLEQRIGRRRAKRWGPRLIDIDILFYDALVYEDDILTIPHPYLAERSFVVGPLADIAPKHRHPQTGVTVAEMASLLDLSSLKPAGFSLSAKTKS